MKKVIVAASSLPAGRNMSSQIEYIQRVSNFGADFYHLDVMDGNFVKAKTIDYTYFTQLQGCSTLLLDAHLMVSNPQKVLSKYLKTGISILTVHYEVYPSIDQLLKTIKKIKKAGKMAGISIDKDTQVSVLDPVLPFVDLVLIMSVKAGKGGQKFDEKAIEKIKYIRGKNKKVLIEVDGGINDQTGALCIKAGADILVVGNYIYNGDAYESILALHNCALTKKVSK